MPDNARVSNRRQDYSASQLNLIRDALKDLHLYGSGVPGKKLSWRRIVEEIATYTDLDLEPGYRRPDEEPETAEERQADARNPGETLEETHHRLLKNITERLRQFAEGVSKKRDPDRKRENEDDLRQYVVEYLTHDEVRKLSPETLANPDISLEPARQLAEFLWDRKPGDGETYAGPVGSCFTDRVDVNRNEYIHIRLDAITHPFIAVAMEVGYDKETLANQSVCHGWSVLTPEGHSLVFTKEQLSTANRCYSAIDGNGGKETGHWLILHKDFGAAQITEGSLKSIRRYLAANMPKEKLISFDFIKNILKNYIGNIEVFQVVESFSLHINQIKYKSKEVQLKQQDERLGLFQEQHSEKEYMINEMTKSAEKKKSTNLFEAIKSCDIEGFCDLVKSGADVNEKEPKTLLTPLHYIAAYSRREELRAIIQRDDLDYLSRDWKGRLPSTLAILSGQDPVILRFLCNKELRQNTDPDFMAKSHGDYPFPN